MPRLEKLRRPGQGERLGAAWRTVCLVLYGPFSLMVKCSYRHLERMPATGPVIIVVNHVSHIDPFLVAKLIIDSARTPRFFAKDSIFAVPVVGAAMRGMGHIPVKRGSVEAAQSLRAAVEALDSGRLIVLHPEGTVTRDPDGWPMTGRTGAARLALLAADVPVIPVAQWGVQDSFDLYRKRFRLIPRPRHTLSIGEPIDLSSYRDRKVTAAVLREVTDLVVRRLRDDVAELRGVPAPSGELFRWNRTARPSQGAA
ncbi:MAG: 1-acyl-sn-glycerol-3-phosphate acyltransferase [Actinomycetota bacterium]|nr:1-acyl-sn-glycerol-3-phosphate acyltransferase [Actinomycetota bacterium]